jgi:PIN domain nuclease of toxin-antitoxin system
MNLLLDTHIILWHAEASSSLSSAAAQAIEAVENNIFVSIASAWEITIKSSIGKLDIDGGVETFFEIADKNGFIVVPILPTHLKSLERLPYIHRDPFDRLLIATSIEEDMVFVTADDNCRRYASKQLW